jgi:phosphoribosylamine---glycine ligase
MKICMPSPYGEGAYFSWLMSKAGHDVILCIEEPRCKNALSGLVNSVESLEDPEKFDLCLFDVTGSGKLADEIRTKTPTIGDSVLADRLEEDRVFALDFMQKCGIQVSPWEQFTDISDAIRYIKQKKTPQVFKPVGEQDDKSTTYVSKSAEDMLRYLEVLFRSTPQKEFVLQEVVKGTEISTEVYINANGYYALNHTLEVKRFLNGDLGPNTGCAGSLVWMTDRDDSLFDRGLKKAIKPLQEMGYVGPLDLNTIVNDQGAWGLEFCARFGYDGTALLTRLLPIEFGEFLFTVAAGGKIPPIQPKHSFCASTRLSVPPYPAEALPPKFYKAGIPLHGLTEKMLDKFFVYDVQVGINEQLESAGICGWIGSPLAVGETPGQAFDGVYDMLKEVRVPNGQYRTDILSNTAKRYAQVQADGWLRKSYDA